MADKDLQHEISDSVTHTELGVDGIAAGEEIDELADEVRASMGAAAEQREKEQVEAGAAKRAQLEAEHGEDYHGFGHPPKKDDD